MKQEAQNAIIDFEKARQLLPPRPKLREGDVINLQGWFIIQEVVIDINNIPVYFLGQPRHSLDNFKTYIHPSMLERDNCVANEALHGQTNLDHQFFKIVSAEKDQIIGIESDVSGKIIEPNRYIEFDPQDILVLPHKINDRAADIEAYPFRLTP